MTMVWNAAFLIAAVLATVWTVRLRTSGDPAWKLGAGAAVMGLVGGAAGLAANSRWEIVAVATALPTTLLASYWIWSFRRDVDREMNS
jgi:hypothetical protein